MIEKIHSNEVVKEAFMGFPSLSLNDYEEEMYSELIARHTLERIYRKKGIREKITEAANVAYELYKSLKDRDYPIFYSGVLLHNRDLTAHCGPESFEFHDNLDSIEDLINFIKKYKS